MPPRTAKRSRRAPIPATEKEAASSSCLATTLPTEILLEVLSCFNYIPITEENPADLYNLTTEDLERQDALRSLSQTCRAWRTLFFPLLWETVEMAVFREGGKAWYRQIQETLESKCEGLAKNPELAKLVRGVRFALSAHEMPEALAALTKGLKACPELKTVSVWFTTLSSGKVIKDGMAGQTFPSVETVLLPSQAHGFLRCFPSVKEVRCSKAPGPIVSAIQAKCKKVEVLAGMRYREEEATLVKRIVKAAPNLRELRFEGCPPPNLLSALSSLKHLQAIELTSEDVPNTQEVKDWYKSELEALRKATHNCTVTLKAIVPSWSNGETRVVEVYIGA